jgi:hypothetical protein
MDEKNYITYCIKTIIIVVLILCWLPVAVAENNPSGQWAYYEGPISAEANLLFFQRVAERPIKRLVITSAGGEVEAGIDLGYWVHKNRIDIEVPEYCLSSCANYVFTSGRHKYVREGAVVAWHGNYNHLKQTGLWKDDITYRMERTGEDEDTASVMARALVDRLVEMEQAFFSMIDVNEFICWVGKMPPYNVPDYYFMSVEDMGRFNVLDVSVPTNYGETTNFMTNNDIQFISLDDEQNL